MTPSSLLRHLFGRIGQAREHKPVRGPQQSQREGLGGDRRREAEESGGEGRGQRRERQEETGNKEERAEPDEAALVGFFLCARLCGLKEREDEGCSRWGIGIRWESSSSEENDGQKGVGFFPFLELRHLNSGSPFFSSLLSSLLSPSLLPRQRHQEQERPSSANEHAVESQRGTDGQDRVRRQDEHRGR